MKIKLTIDPTDHFIPRGVKSEALMEACGIIPYWATDLTLITLPLREALNKAYQFGLFEMKGCTITEDGIHQYPEDPDLHPLIKLTRGDETLYMYQHAIVAIVQSDGSTFVTRMD